MSKSDSFQPDFRFIRATSRSGQSYRGFQWPTEPGALVEAPDWDPEPVCGGGLHGLADGIGNWALLPAPGDPDALWYICEAMRDEAVDLDGKIKVPRCRVVLVGSFAEAMTEISPEISPAIERLVAARVEAASGSSGYSGAATASGYRGAATASGDSGAATASGDSGAATASGEHCVAVAAGRECRARVAEGCLLVLVERDESDGKIIAYFASMCGENGVQADVFYELRGGRLVRADES